MKASNRPFRYFVGAKEFNTLAQAKAFANGHEDLEIGIAKCGIYQALKRYNPMSEKLETVISETEAKEKINNFLQSEEEQTDRTT